MPDFALLLGQRGIEARRDGELEAWACGLNDDDSAAAAAWMRAHDSGFIGRRMRTYMLVDTKEAAAAGCTCDEAGVWRPPSPSSELPQVAIWASCEVHTMTARAWVPGKKETIEGVVYGIATVYVDVDKRGKGCMPALLSRVGGLLTRLPGSLGCVLYSDVGLLYRKVGFYEMPAPARDWVLPTTTAAADDEEGGSDAFARCVAAVKVAQDSEPAASIGRHRALAFKDRLVRPDEPAITGDVAPLELDVPVTNTAGSCIGVRLLPEPPLAEQPLPSAPPASLTDATVLRLAPSLEQFTWHRAQARNRRDGSQLTLGLAPDLWAGAELACSASGASIVWSLYFCHEEPCMTTLDILWLDAGSDVEGEGTTAADRVAALLLAARTVAAASGLAEVRVWEDAAAFPSLSAACSEHAVSLGRPSLQPREGSLPMLLASPALLASEEKQLPLLVGSMRGLWF